MLTANHWGCLLRVTRWVSHLGCLTDWPMGYRSVSLQTGSPTELQTAIQTAMPRDSCLAYLLTGSPMVMSTGWRLDSH